MKLSPLAVAVALVTSGSVARGGAAFDEYSATVARRPASQLREAACDVDIELRGAVAVVTVRQRIVNPGPGALAASLELTLPAGAQVTGFTLRGQRAVRVDAHAPSIEGGTDVLGIDPAVLQRDADAYRILLQPIAQDHDAMFETRYVMLAEPRGGALHLVLPGRPAAGLLTVCQGTIRALPGPGATVRKIRIGGLDAGTSRAAFALAGRDLAIAVELAVAGTQPIAWVQTQPLADGWHASLVTVLGPQVKPAGARRVVLLVDGSRSMDLVGRHNVVKVINRLGAALPRDAEIEAIVYDREVTRVFGELRPATPQNLAAIETAVTQRGSKNGSDIVGAFARARELVDGARGQAMVIVITDGVTGDVDGAALTRALGAKTSTVDVHAIVLDPAATSSPETDALRAPVNLFGGAYVEVAVDRLDDALTAIDGWVRPAWLDLALGDAAIPREVRAGGGFTHLLV
ncbi:MAG: VWA domain-containing protein, partial [Myxococcota bacterium]|nr:VWA domain-containing protein [Myxococcota bacterium]